MSPTLVEDLLSRCLVAPPWAVPAVAADVLAQRWGVDVEIALADHAQRCLQGLLGGGEVPVGGADGAGAVFVDQRVRRVRSAGREVVHAPTTLRGERLGVLTVRGEASGLPPDAVLAAAADTVALLLDQASTGTDRIERWRRTTDLSLAAELQWGLMPAQGVVGPSFTLAAHLEPAAQVSSDLYDWSWSSDGLWFTLLDATGPRGHRGLAAAQTAALALTALRNARRAGASLEEQAWLADQAVADHEGGASSVTALLGRFDVTTGRALLLGAGGPALALLGAPGGWEPQVLGRHAPLGRGEQEVHRCDEVVLGPGQHLVAVSDGVLRAGGPGGQRFGADRLRALLDAAGDPLDVPRRVVDAVVDHARDGFDDDATVLVLARHPGEGRDLRSCGSAAPA